MSIQPIKVYGKGGPNPPKVVMAVNELNIPHEVVPVSFPDLKKPDFLAINPNGRMPAIQDPNTGLTLWESGAILEYLVDKYDKERKISFEPGTNEDYLAKQWLYFQVSGQGPYYGQGVWFHKFHQEKIPSAVERYLNEVKRVTGVLEIRLKEQKEKNGTDAPWLVGNKFSYADLSFITWQNIITDIFQTDALDLSEFVEVKGWLERMKARPAIKKVLADMAH